MGIKFVYEILIFEAEKKTILNVRVFVHGLVVKESTNLMGNLRLRVSLQDNELTVDRSGVVVTNERTNIHFIHSGVYNTYEDKT